MKAVGMTNTGRVRKINEDSYLCQEICEGGCHLCIVADGMGGHNAGEVASAMAVKEIADYINSNINEVSNSEEYCDLIRKAVNAANEKVYKKSILSTNCVGMGTTLSMAILCDSVLYIGHVGDSRIYLIRNKEIKKLTDDHSLVAELVKSGSITEEDATNHPQKNVITRALGTDYSLEVDITYVDVLEGDRILLCTDGLSNLVTEKEMAEAFDKSKDLEDICSSLINTANERGGFDNITLIAIQICKGGDCGDR